MNNPGSPFADYQLARWPFRENDKLQAWDAADEYLLDYLNEKNLPAAEPSRLLIINDSFGALTCALNQHAPVNWSDSKISHLAANENCRRNNITPKHVSIPSTEPLQGKYDLVLIRVPKTNALLEDQLRRLRPHLHARTVIVAAAMVKHLPRAAYQCYEKIIGPSVPSLTRKKARLQFVTLDDSIVLEESPYPSVYTDPLLGFELSNHASVFSREHLDHGARFLLEHYDGLPAANKVVDLACGNGVLGIMYQKQHITAVVQFVDESYMAIASARQNYEALFPDSSAVYEAADGLHNTDAESVDLIVCNPPFHQQHVVGSQIALQLFSESKRCLQQHGELWVVANRHLDYGKDLRVLFGNCRIIAENRKFMVLRVVKR